MPLGEVKASSSAPRKGWVIETITATYSRDVKDEGGEAIRDKEEGSAINLVFSLALPALYLPSTVSARSSLSMGILWDLG